MCAFFLSVEMKTCISNTDTLEYSHMKAQTHTHTHNEQIDQEVEIYSLRLIFIGSDTEEVRGEYIMQQYSRNHPLNCELYSLNS